MLSTITLPSHVSLLKDIPAFEKNARVLKHSLILKPGVSINYSLYLEKLSQGREPINSRFSYTIKGISDAIENNTYVDVIAAKSEITIPSVIKIEEKKSNESILNLTAAKDVQISQPVAENKTGEVKTESGNKTADQIVITDAQKPKEFSKNILVLSIAVFAAFLIVVITIFKMRKGKKKDDVMEKLEEELKSGEIK